MNFEEYVRHMTQKLRVGVAIAVIKNKPENLSVNQYIAQLQAKLNKEMKSDDLDVTICSDDFEYHENDVTFFDSQQTNASPTILNDLCSKIDEHEGQHKNSTTLHYQNLQNTDSNQTYCMPSVINNEAPLGKDISDNIDKDNVCNQQHYDEIMETNTPMIQGDDKFHKTDLNKTNFDSEQTELYSVHNFTQDNTHVSQTQDVDFPISEKYLRKKVTNNDLAEFNNHNVIYNNSINTADCNQEDMICDQDPNTDKIENQNFSQNAQNFDIEDNDDVFSFLNELDMLSQKQPENDKDNNNTENNGMMEQKEDEKEMIALSNVSEDESLSSQEEVVPFKVIEELNKIKKYLYRRAEKNSTDGCSTDSGYKSNSQRKSITNSLQLSDSWLNQSAHSLFDYITRCPLKAITRDICQEMSQVLGNLIDQLHHDENYPRFLELLLEYVDTTLQYILEGERSGDDLCLKKDEYIHRLFLLNKSIHIIKYTIEKVTNILETVHSKLTSKENLCEIINITETENVCYLFNVLEVLLKRFKKRKKVSTQNSIKPSQDDKMFPKKSAITDIWRKKWNPNYKEEVKIEGTIEKKCVTVKCTEVLNKMVVECMDGYSLVAFAALQCFNLLKN